MAHPFAILARLAVALLMTLVTCSADAAMHMHGDDAAAPTASATGASSDTDVAPGAAAEGFAVTNTPLDFFTNWGRYMPRTHCLLDEAGNPDWPWIIGLIVANLCVIVGYLRIFVFWRRSYLAVAPQDRNEKLMQLAWIFLWCAVCGYGLSLVIFFWPVYRLLLVCLVVLSFFTWKFIASLSDFSVSFSARALQRQLQEDITARAERLEAEVARRTSELESTNHELRLLSLVASRTANAVVITDAKGETQWINDGFTRMTGYTLEEVRGQKPGEMLQGPDTDPATVQFMRERIAVGEGFETEVLNYSKEGRPYWVLVEVQPIVEDGRITQFVAIELDITEKRESQEQLREALEDAERANEAKSRFLANVSHEMRTPLVSIIGFSDLLVRHAESDLDERDEWVQSIHRSGRHLHELINDLLDLSKIEAGRMEFERTQVEPLQVITELISTMRVAALEKGLSLDLELGSDVPAEIHTDPMRMRQVIMNLLSNAVKFTSSGGIRLVLSCDHEADQPQLMAQVIDSGIGMNDAAMRRIFAPFVQGDTSISRKYGGTGLGLAVSRHICEQLGGTLTVTSEPGKGSTFTATFATGPLDSVQWIDRQSTEIRAGRSTIHEQLVNTRLSGRVLLADDGNANRKYIDVVLSRAGATVTCVEDGQQAIDAVKASSQPYDLVLLDIQMPVMDGLTAIKRLRADGFDRPILALTAHAMESERQRCFDAGFDAHIAKPVEVEQLLAQVQHYLGADVAPPAPDDATIETASPPAPSAMSAPPAAVASDDIEPLQSTLPMDDEEFRDIAQEFVQMAHDKLSDLHAALEGENLDEVGRLLHWLKGSGGSGGYMPISDAAITAQQYARDRELDALRGQVEAIDLLLTRARRGIELLDTAATAERMHP